MTATTRAMRPIPIVREDSRTMTKVLLHRFDSILVASALALLGLGLVTVYSASAAFAARTYADAQHFLWTQLRWMFLGTIAMYVAARIPGKWLRRYAPQFFVSCVVACVLVLVPGIGHLAGGARRWLVLGPIGFQPSELAKLAVVLALAAMLARRDSTHEENRRSLVWPILLPQLPAALILIEPDLGTALVIELLLATMVFVAGLKLRALIVAGLAALPVFYHLVMGTPFRLQRLLSYVDPWAYRSTVGYQVTEALISIGSGGFFGVGLGQGKHKLFFLPESHTDFIFAILAEELGFVGVVGFLLILGLVVTRAVKIALSARDPFDTYLAVGLGALIAVPAVFNMCVATALLPTKGLPLPFISYGGSNLFVNMTAIGLLLRISAQSVPRSEDKS